MKEQKDDLIINEFAEQLKDDTLEVILEMNDIDECEVLVMLWEQGWIRRPSEQREGTLNGS